MTRRDTEDDETGGTSGTVGAVTSDLERLLEQPLAPGLHVVATPIGNLGDMSLRAIAVLARADVVYCEDTRRSRTLLAHFRLRAPLRAYHEHNGAAERPRILAALERGESVALISDAGTPLVSDPGFKLVRDVIAAGHRVEGVPGASALLAALTVAGVATDAFHFAGFLPPKASARRTRIGELAAVRATIVLYEAPQRLAATLADLAAGLGGRTAAVARELTKLHEDVTRGTLTELATAFSGSEVRGEVVVVVGPAGETVVTDDEIGDLLRAKLRDMRLKDASRAIAETLGVPRSRVYDLGIELQQEGDTSLSDGDGGEA